MFSTLLSLIFLAGFVNNVFSLTADEFKAIISKSRLDCLTGRQDRDLETRYERGECGLDTIHTMYSKIPGNQQTVAQFQPYELGRTLALCAERENKKGTDWSVIIANRYRLGASAYTEVWNECQRQIDAEKADCKQAKNVLCAFEHGTAFNCPPDSQLKRHSTTIEKGDQCTAISSLVDGRPANASDFNARLVQSRKDCSDVNHRQSTDTANQFVNTNCHADQKLSILMTHFPQGISQATVLAYAAGPQPGLRETFTMCQDRETAGGFAKINAAAWRPQFSSTRADCQQQLTQQQKDCKTLTQMLCAYSFGVDYTCWNQDLKRNLGAAKKDECAEIVNDLLTAN